MADTPPPGHGPHWLDKYIAQHAAAYGMTVEAYVQHTEEAAIAQEAIEREPWIFPPEISER